MAAVAVHYFTGTGNTARAVKRVTTALEQAGHVVFCRQVTKGVQAPAGEHELHLFAYPTLSLSAPTLMKRYVRRLPRGRGAKAAVLALTGGTYHEGTVSPGGPGQGLVQVEGLLRRRGYDVFLTRAVSFPVNWTQMMEPPDEVGRQAILACGEAEVDNFIRDILAGQKSLHRIGILSWILGRLLAVLFGLFGRRALGKLYIADGSCNGCGLCARACPAGAILMRGGRPRWRINCEDCCRCINICPGKSIQFSAPLLVFHLVLQAAVMVWVIPSLLGLIAWPDPVSQGLRILGGVLLYMLLFTVLTIFQFTVLDAAIFILSRIKPVRRFFSLGWTRRYRRYTAPGFKPLKPG